MQVLRKASRSHDAACVSQDDGPELFRRRHLKSAHFNDAETPHEVQEYTGQAELNGDERDRDIRVYQDLTSMSRKAGRDFPESCLPIY